MDAVKTSLSAGAVIYHALLNDSALMERITGVYPVFVPKEVSLPYVYYHRAGLDASASTGKSADAVEIEMAVCAADYAESIEIAELVRAALDYKQPSIEGLKLRSCTLSYATEVAVGDAYVQLLNFTIRI